MGIRPRVVVAAVGDPESTDTWSGIPAGLLGALSELDVLASPLDLTLAPGVEQMTLLASALASRNRYDAESAPLTVGVRARRARRRMRLLRPDGVIQIGTTIPLAPVAPYVTFEDMTLRQASAIHPVFRRMSARAIQVWEQRRAGIYARAHMCAVASHWAADSLLADYGVPPERVAVVGFGANHRSEVTDRAWRPPRFLFIGFDWERKGGPTLLRAFSRVRAVCPGAVLDVVGGHPPLRLEGVNGHGALSQARADHRALMIELLAAATCLVMPSLVEPFGIVHVEAASAGIPSIASSVGGSRDVIGADGGLLVDPGDEDGLYAAMQRLCDPTLASQMGRAARSRAQLYTWTKVAERLLRALGLSTPDGRALAEFIR